jgi:hypothetical protein
VPMILVGVSIYAKCKDKGNRQNREGVKNRKK